MSDTCDDCGHLHAPDGCTGPPTPSDLWAGVSVAGCDCDYDRAASTDECDNEMCSLSLGHGGMHRPHGVPATTEQADATGPMRSAVEVGPDCYNAVGWHALCTRLLAALDASPAPTTPLDPTERNI